MSGIFDITDTETIEKLADIVCSRELSEITITDSGKTITIKGKKCIMPPPPAVQAPAAVIPAAAAPVPAAKKNEDLGGNIIKAPIVGTYYQSPSPDKPPFVKVGDKVKKGDIIMIIESMKLMNEIQSEFDGTVENILVSNGQAVEYDQPLMIIK